MRSDPDEQVCLRIQSEIWTLPLTDDEPVACCLLCLQRTELEFVDLVWFSWQELHRRADRAMPHLLAILKDKKEEVSFRRTVSGVLYTIAHNITPTSGKVVSTLIPLLDDEDEEIAVEVARTLSIIGRDSAQARRGLEKAVRKGRTSYIRMDAAASLYQLDRSNRLSVPALIAGLRSQDKHLRRVAADRLWWFGPDAKEEVPALIDVLGDEDFEVRYSAVQVLGRVGPAAAAAVPRLLELQNDPSKGMRRAVSEALAKICS